jgi:hypothetical protein
MEARDSKQIDGNRAVASRPSVAEYLAIGAIIVSGGVAVVKLAGGAPIPADARDLVSPLTAMFALTAIVWSLMVISRNGAVLLGAASVRYFEDYKTEPPVEWIERPARAFNNLMQVPTLFYVVAVVLMSLHAVDVQQVLLAWFYVGCRVVHAIVYIAFNYVPFRFAFYAVSCIALATMWARLASSAILG